MRLSIHGLGGKFVLPLLCLIAWSLPGGAARAADDNEPAFVAVSVGGFDVNKRDNQAVLGQIEYRSGWKLWEFKPIVGLMATSDGAAYAYAGIMLDIFWGRRIVTSFSFAPGAYHEGDGKDLGHWIEFRSQAEIAYRFDNRARLGIALNHLSNASIGDENPGSEQLMLTYSHPIGGLFGK